MHSMAQTALAGIVLTCACTLAAADTKQACGDAYDRFYTATLGAATADMSAYFAVGGLASIEQACTALALNAVDRTRADAGTLSTLEQTELTMETYGDLAGRLVYKACMVNSTQRLVRKRDYKLVREHVIADCPFDSLVYPASDEVHAAPSVTPAVDAALDASRDAWHAAVKQKVARHGSRSVASRPGTSCMARLELLPNGEVINVRIAQSSGDTAFDASIEAAILKASPLPLPAAPTAFQRVLVLDFGTASGALE